MYNSEQKARFILEYSKSLSTNRFVTAIFNAMEPFETEWGADLCTKDTETLQPAVDSLASVRIGRGWSPIYILKEYVRWCIRNHVPGAVDGITGIQIEGLKAVRTRLVSSPLHLQRCLDEVFGPLEEETVAITYRCFFWLAFAGVDEEDVYTLTADNVDFASQSIVIDGTSYPIYREALPAIKKATELTSFNYKHPNYGKVVRRDRIPGELLLRGIRGEVTKLNIRANLSKMARNAVVEGRCNTELSYSRIYLSGIFFRMYEKERAGIPVDFSEDAKRFMAGKTYQNKTRKNRQTEIEKDYEKDYQRWKMVFSV